MLTCADVCLCHCRSVRRGATWECAACALRQQAGAGSPPCMCLHTTICVLILGYMRCVSRQEQVLLSVCVLILLYVLIRLYVPLYYYMCALILLYMCPHTRIYAQRQREGAGSPQYVCPHTAVCVLILLYVPSYYYMCALILLYMCPHTTIYAGRSRFSSICVSSYCCMCPHTTMCVPSYCSINMSSYYYICGEEQVLLSQLPL